MRGISAAAARVVPLLLCFVWGAHAQPAATGAPGRAQGHSGVAAAAPAKPASTPSNESSVAELEGNVLTVRALLKTENDLALAKAKQERLKAGLDTEAGLTKSKPRGTSPLHATVESIAGTEGHLRAFLTAAGQRYEKVGVGSKVASCKIVAIENKCVIFAPVVAKRSASLCPTACWTGIVATPAAIGGVGAAAAALLPPGAPGGPLPPPLAAPAALASVPVAK